MDAEERIETASKPVTFKDAIETGCGCVLGCGMFAVVGVIGFFILAWVVAMFQGAVDEFRR